MRAGERLLARGRAAGGTPPPARAAASSLVLVLVRRARGARGRAPRPGRGARRARAPRARRGRRRSRHASTPGELERVVWAEPDAVAWAPVDVVRRARASCSGTTARPPMLVSATLTPVNDSFDFVRRRLGIDRASELVVGSPYDFREQALLYVPRSMPDPRPRARSSAWPRRSSRCCALSRGPRARADELVPRARRDRANGSAAGSRTPVLVQGEAPRERLLERFRAEVDSVLMATATFWQGVDVPGEALSLLVIDKLPFCRAGRPAPRGTVRADRRRRAATGSATTRSRPRCSSSARASAG